MTNNYQELLKNIVDAYKAKPLNKLVFGEEILFSSLLTSETGRKPGPLGPG
jgi:hypothetical protein